MGVEPEIWQHKEWLGLVQPVGLVVSPLALVKHQAIVDRGEAISLQPKLRKNTNGVIEDFPTFAVEVLEWLPEDLVTDLPIELEIPLPIYGEILKPTYAVADPG